MMNAQQIHEAVAAELGFARSIFSNYEGFIEYDHVYKSETEYLKIEIAFRLDSGISISVQTK